MSCRHLLDLPLECVQQIVSHCDTGSKIALIDTSQSTRRLVEMSLPKLNVAARTVSPHLFTLFLESSGLPARIPFWSCYTATRRNKQQAFSVWRTSSLFPSSTSITINTYPRTCNRKNSEQKLNVAIIVTDRTCIFLSQSCLNGCPNYTCLEPVYKPRRYCNRIPIHESYIVEKRGMLVDRATYRTKLFRYIVPMNSDEYWLPFRSIFDETLSIYDDSCFDSFGNHLGPQDFYTKKETIQSVEILKLRESAFHRPNTRLQKFENEEQSYCTIHTSVDKSEKMIFNKE